MSTADYLEAAQDAKDAIEEDGRAITLYQLSATPADGAKPWRGSAAHTITNPQATFGLFIVPNTSIPTESRGLGFDWVDVDLLARTRHVCIVPALGLPDLKDFKVIRDDLVDWEILWGQCLQPGDTRIIYVFGVAQ